METEARHQCLIYEGAPSKKLQSIAAIIERKLEEGYRCLYLNSAPMVAGIRSTLSAKGMDVVNEIAKSRLVLSSEPVSKSWTFNSKAMLNRLEDALDQALTDGYVGLWATGDMTWEFGPDKNFSKLLEYEMGLEEIFQRRTELSGICQYHKDTLPQEAMRQSLLTHSGIVINDTVSKINPYYLQSTRKEKSHASPHELDDMIAAICGMA